MSPARLSAVDRVAAARGWSAADVDPSELVGDAWIAANTVPGKAPSKVRAVGGRMLAAVRTIGVDPLDGAEKADLSGLLPVLPRPVRRALLQRGGLTRDQMRRIAARTGYPYVEAWSGHNRGGMKGVWGALVHHTGTPWSVPGDYPTLRVVRDGRPGLENSLCAFGLGRSGTIYLVSEKLSWHAGAGEYRGVTDGNGYMAGIEAESDGKNWTAEERDCYPRLVASILIEIGMGDPRPDVGDKYTTRHASFALPRGRKTDASGLDMDLFWRQVYAYLADPASITRGGGAPLPVQPGPAPAPAPAPTPAGGLTAPTPWPSWMPAGHFFGLLSGPADSHGGATAEERRYVKLLQKKLQAAGFAPAGAGWADGVFEQPTKDAVAAWQRARMPGTTRFGEVWADDWAVLVNGAAGPTPRPAAAPWPSWVPRGSYFGLITGPARSLGGATPREREAVLVIQRALQRKGYAPNSAGWADGKFEQATANAVAAFQRREMRGTQFYGQVWADDWAVLTR